MMKKVRDCWPEWGVGASFFMESDGNGAELREEECGREVLGVGTAVIWTCAAV